MIEPQATTCFDQCCLIVGHKGQHRTCPYTKAGGSYYAASWNDPKLGTEPASIDKDVKDPNEAT